MTRPRDITAPMDIERESMRIIDAEVPEPRPFAGAQWLVVRRMIHTTADFELLDLARFSPGAVQAGVAALAAGCALFTDTHMARCAIPLRRLAPLGCSIACFMDDPEVAGRARSEGITRARAAVDHAAGRMDGAILVVGNAPTALLRILEHVQAGRMAPALVVGMPVGFVNAAESKELLMAQDAIPYITIAGRKGGSSLAASVINALLKLAREKSGV